MLLNDGKLVEQHIQSNAQDLIITFNKNNIQIMKILKLKESILLYIFVCPIVVATWYVRDSFIDPIHKLWARLITTFLLVVASMIYLYYKEKSTDKPDYKKLFYFTFFYSLFVYLNILLRK
jgi:hypothetical protein